ncbi:MAG: hypothetical protein RL328_716 [Acidobacteriota bacterium]
MGLIRDWKIKRRADRLLKALDRAAANPDLYGDEAWQQDALASGADLLDEIPMPSQTRTRLMNLLALLQNAYKSPISTLAGVGAAYLGYLAAGTSPKGAAIMLLSTVLGVTHAGAATK